MDVEPPKKLIEYADLIEETLPALLARNAVGVPPVLAEAIFYGVCGGGKRFRGGLAIGACVAVGGEVDSALPAACALEMAHAFSLIHDDLPCMDNSDLRRGKPSAHKKYGEAMALLAGDALLVEGILAVFASAEAAPDRLLAAVGVLLRALGAQGMIGGQVLDLQAEHTRPDLEALRRLDAGKTGALIRAAAVIGGLLGGADQAQISALDCYADAVGLAFQITDDLLDLSASTAALGKPAGADAAKEKATYPSLLGREGARELAQLEIGKALAALAPFATRGEFLAELAKYVLDRDR